MTIKHLNKNALLHKVAFFAAIIVIVSVAVFSLCASQQASARVNVDSVEIGNCEIVEDFNRCNTSFSTAQFNECNEDLSSSANWVNDWTIEGSGEYWIGTNDGPYLWTNGNLSSYFTNINDAVYCEICTDDENTLYFDFYSNDLYGDWIGFSFKYYNENNDDEDTRWTYSKNDGKVENVPNWLTESSVIQVYLNDTYNFAFYYPGLKPVSMGVNVSGRIIDAETKMPVPFANVVYCQWDPFWGYTPNWEISAKTEWWGGYTLEGINEDMLPGKVMAFGLGYEFDGGESGLIGWIPEGIETIYRDVWVSPIHYINFADVTINGGEHHINFVTTYKLLKDGKVVESDDRTLDTIKFKIPLGASYAVYDDGTLHCSYSYEENGLLTEFVYTLTAIADEGYTLDKWNINGNDIVTGESYILDKDVMGLVSYKKIDEPVPPIPPAPDPAPVNPGGEIVQTGDTTPFTAIAMLAVVAALACGMCIRKEYF